MSWTGGPRMNTVMWVTIQTMNANPWANQSWIIMHLALKNIQQKKVMLLAD